MSMRGAGRAVGADAVQHHQPDEIGQDASIRYRQLLGAGGTRGMNGNGDGHFIRLVVLNGISPNSAAGTAHAHTNPVADKDKKLAFTGTNELVIKLAQSGFLQAHRPVVDYYQYRSGPRRRVSCRAKHQPYPPAKRAPVRRMHRPTIDHRWPPPILATTLDTRAKQ